MSLRRYSTSKASDVCFTKSLIKTYVPVVHVLTCTSLLVTGGGGVTKPTCRVSLDHLHMGGTSAEGQSINGGDS